MTPAHPDATLVAVYPALLALIVPNTRCNMVRVFTTLGLFFPPRVCFWDAIVGFLTHFTIGK